MRQHELQRYQYLNSNDYHDYDFYSEGPKGPISKMVTFSRIPNTNPLLTIWHLLSVHGYGKFGRYDY